MNRQIYRVQALFLMLAILSSTQLFGQSATNSYFDVHNMMPTSPDAAILGRFGETPISYYTGTSEIAVPIYTIEDKEAHFSLPITLRYHASGIKVEDQAGVAGLGWSLQAEGTIIHVVNGKEDTLDEMAINDPGGYQGLKNTSISGAYSQKTITCQVMSVGSDGIGDSLGPVNMASQGDGQPDIYIYNFADYSGKFYINPVTHQVVLINPTQQITFQRTGQETWSATTIDGNVFYFNTLEQSNNIANVFSTGYTCKLSSIVLNDGKEIDFSYASGSYQWYTYYENYHEGYPYGLSPVNEVGIVPSSTPSYFYEQYLSKITANNVVINFNLQGRGDLGGLLQNGTWSNAQRLKSIDIQDPVTGRRLKTFNFGCSYFPYTTAGGDYTDPEHTGHTTAQYDTLGKRLRLDSVQEVGYTSTGSPVPMPAYKFYYDSTHILPLKSSFARDYWGYFNGTTTNTCLTPDLNFLYGAQYQGYTNVPGFVLQLNAANRAPDRQQCMAGVLEKIVYPTGGYTTLSYQPNEFKNYIYPDQTKIKDATVKGYIASNNLSTDVTSTGHIVLNKTAVIQVKNVIERGANTSVTFSQLQPSYVELIKIKFGNLKILNTWQMLSTAQYTDSFSTGSNYEYSWIANIVVPYDSGAYYILSCALPSSLGAQGTSTNNASVSCTYTYYALPDSDTAVSYGAGLRVASIANYDMNGNVTSQKNLRYVNRDSSTSGILMSPLVYLANRPMYFVRWLSFVGGDVEMNYWESGADTIPFMTSESAIPYSDGAAGNLVGYSRVEELNVAPDGSNNGRKVYVYHNQPSQTMLDCPDVPDLLNGKVIQDEVLDAAGDSLEETNYTYVDNYTEHNLTPAYFDGLKMITYYYGSPISAFSQNISSAPNWQTTDFETIDFYPINSAWYIPRTKTSNYYSGSGVLTNTITYSYNMLGQLIEQDSRNSKNEPTATQYVYPNDTSSSVASLLRSVGLLNEVVSEKDWVGSNLMSETDIYYGWLGSIVAKDSIDRTVNGGQASNEFTFSKYGPFRTLDQYYKRNALASCLWDYRNELVVATAENAAYADIAFTSFEADGSGNWIIPDTTRIRAGGAFTGNLYYNLTGANAISDPTLTSTNTYTVTYWGYTGSAITINGSPGTAKVTLGNWTNYEAQVSGTSTVTVGGTGGIDELRLYPKGALMTTYTYAPLIGITSKCDPAGRTLYFTYDGLGRLHMVQDQYGNILKRYDYEYQTSNQ
jgi:hypothetical protein